jgi:hypothetical protein
MLVAALAAVGGGQVLGTTLLLGMYENRDPEAWIDHVLHGRTTMKGSCVIEYFDSPQDFPECLFWFPPPENLPCLCVQPVECNC